MFGYSRILSLLILAFSQIVISCNKETSLEIAGSSGPNATTKGRLVKVISRFSSPISKDSTTTYFYYDVAGRLSKTRKEGIWEGVNQKYDVDILRNSDGKVIQVSKAGPDSSAVAGVDTWMINPTTGHYVYKIGYSDFANNVKYDSCNYYYDAENRIRSIDYYFFDVPGIPSPYLGLNKIFAYDENGNTKSETFITYNTGSIDTLVLFCEYDTKKMPLAFTNEESYLLPFTDVYSNNNIVSMKSDKTGIQFFHFVNQYTYNSANQPATNLQTIIHDNNRKIYSIFYYE